MPGNDTTWEEARPDRRRVVIFWILFAGCLLPWVGPPVALVAGVAFGFLVGNPQLEFSTWLKNGLLKASIVGLGFAVNFQALVRTGSTGAGVTVLTLGITLFLGWMLAKVFRVERVTGQLIAVGTAVCGGSAIAAMGPVLGADERQMSVSLGCVFVLNAVALVVFPLVGHWAGLDPVTFGWWSAIAIHDMSSVAGAAAHFGPAALAVAVPVKLARTLWIVPTVIVVAAAARRGGKKIVFPWFIVAFVGTSLLATFFPLGAPVWAAAVVAAKAGLTATLFLIGSGLTAEAVAKVGWRPFLQALALWVVVSVVSLLVLRGVMPPPP